MKARSERTAMSTARMAPMTGTADTAPSLKADTADLAVLQHTHHQLTTNSVQLTILNTLLEEFGEVISILADYLLGCESFKNSNHLALNKVYFSSQQPSNKCTLCTKGQSSLLLASPQSQF